MKTIFFNIPAHGHINPALPVVREMVARGETVICANTEDHRAAHGAVGAQFIAYPTYEDQGVVIDQIGGGNLMQNALMLTHVSERLIPWVFELLDRERPDYVIHDSLAVWAKQAAEQRGIRAATSMSTFVVSRDALPPIKPRMILDLAAQMVPISAPPYLNTPGQCLAFVVEGYNRENPDELAAFLDAVRKCLTKKCQWSSPFLPWLFAVDCAIIKQGVAISLSEPLLPFLPSP